MIQVAIFDAKSYDMASFLNATRTGDISIKFYETKLNIDSAALAAGCQVVSVFVNDVVNAAVIDKLYDLGVRVLALRCAGYNNVDIKHAYGKIHVVHVPSYSPEAVAEHAMAILLTSIRRIHKAYNRTREFNFSLNGLTGFNLNGKTVGIIGTGRIGEAFANICLGFGMRVLAYDINEKTSKKFGYVDLETLFEESDVISLHCPLTKETKHIIDKKAINSMKRGVVIVNTSRGKLIDSEALIEGIKERKVGAACLDVYEEEGDIFYNDVSGHIMEDDVLARLISMPNVLVTGHQAFLTNEALRNIAETTVMNIEDLLIRDGTCKNELCYRCEKEGECKSVRASKCF